MSVRTLDDGRKEVSGYFIVFNSRSLDLGGWVEICSPQMLTRTLRENGDIIALRDHRSELLLGRTTADTLQLNVDSKGLAFRLILPSTAIGDDTAENVRLRNLTGCSFGFNTRSDSWAEDASGTLVRTLLDIDLAECSITSFPAYQATSVVSVRSCPADLRKALKLNPTLDQIISGDDGTDADDDGEDTNPNIAPDDDADADDDEDSDKDREDREVCSCRCLRCQEGDCDMCDMFGCNLEACSACPQQDSMRQDNLRIRSLFALRMK
jgi:hypothetical protein